MEQTNQFGSNHAERFAEKFRSQERIKARVNSDPCLDSQRRLQVANDHFKRANRDLGEVAAFIAASLTTVTAIEAVTNIAVEKIELPKEILRMAFDGYVVFLVAILILGSLRFARVLHRRTQAEKEMDQAKNGIYASCDVKEWLKPEE
jgi:hypothetical protein